MTVMRLAVLLLVLAGLAAPADAAIVRVNTSTNSNYSGSQSSSLASTAQSLTAGNSLIVALSWGVDSASVSSVSDTAGNTYSLVVAVNDGSQWLELWATTNTTGNGSNVVTATLTASVRSWAVNTAQYSGLVTSSVAAMTDLTSTGTAGSNATVTSGTWGPTSQASTVLVAAVRNAAGSGTFTPDIGYSIAVADSNSGYANVSAIEDQIVSSVQSAGSTVSMTYSTPVSWLLVFAAFKETTGGGGSSTTRGPGFLGGRSF